MLTIFSVFLKLPISIFITALTITVNISLWANETVNGTAFNGLVEFLDGRILEMFVFSSKMEDSRQFSEELKKVKRYGTTS